MGRLTYLCLTSNYSCTEPTVKRFRYVSVITQPDGVCRGETAHFRFHEMGDNIETAGAENRQPGVQLPQTGHDVPGQTGQTGAGETFWLTDHEGTLNWAF